jgi:hypothetical protein
MVQNFFVNENLLPFVSRVISLSFFPERSFIKTSAPNIS